MHNGENSVFILKLRRISVVIKTISSQRNQEKFIFNLMTWIPFIAWLFLFVTPASLSACHNKPSNTCRSTTAKEIPVFENQSRDQLVGIFFIYDNQSFSIQATGEYVILKRKKENEVLQRVHAEQYEYGDVSKLVLTKANLLWIDGEETDYVAKLSIDGEIPTIIELKELADLYTHQCHILLRLAGFCIKAGSQYDPESGVITIKGYPKSIFGLASLSTIKIDGHAR